MAIIGEKSSIIPGPPSGDLSISLRIGARIGSVKAYKNSIIRPPLTIGIQLSSTLINISAVRILNSQRTTSKRMAFIYIYLRTRLGKT